jgi:hypothetical protein
MLPTIVKRFLPDDRNPTHVELQIDSSTNPALAQQVVWTDRDEEEPSEAPADEGSLTISIQDFDNALGAPWQTVLKGMGGGGMGGI